MLKSLSAHPDRRRSLDVRTLPRAAADVLFVIIPPLSILSFVLSAHHGHFLGFDFRGTLWDPGQAILHGRTPYPPPHEAAIRTGNPSVYPPVAMLVVAPLTLLPWSVGIAIWLVLVTCSTGAALWLLGVRDWRIYSITLACNPFLIGLNHGNLTLVLLLVIAVGWRWRDRPAVAGACVGAVVAAKLFLWPLLGWLLLTRRLRAAAIAVVLAVVAVLGSWAIIGFAGFRQYPDLLRALDRVYGPHSLAVPTLFVRAGLAETPAEVLAAALAVLLLLGAFMLGRQDDRDRRLYTAAVVGAVVAAPVLWMYYFLLLIVPLVLYRPRLSRVWWLAAGFWLIPSVTNATTGKPACCRPASIPKPAWTTLTTTPSLIALLTTVFVLAIFSAVLLRSRQSAKAATQRA